MGTITLPNFRVSGTDRARVRLKDGGVYVEWSRMTEIKAWLYSVEQKAISGRFDVQVDPQDGTRLQCVYSAQKPQYPGVNKLILQCKYEGAEKAYDKPLWNFVRWTDDQAGEEITIDDPEVDVEIVAEDMSSSVLDEATAAALAAADKANEAAEQIPLEVLTQARQATQEAREATEEAEDAAEHATPHIGENGHWWKWDKASGAYVDTGEDAQGPTGNGIQSVEQTQSSQESEGENVVTVTMTNGTQARFSIRNGKQGERGLQGVPGVANAKYKQVDTLPTASADTMDFIYLTPTQTAGVYDMSYTEQDGNTYTWKPLGTTAIQLADYATKTEVSQLEAEVTDLYFHPGYIDTNTATLPTTRKVSASYHSAISPCSPGQKFIITGTGGNSKYYRMYAWYDVDGNQLEKYSGSGAVSGLEVTAPANAVTAVFNLSSYNPATDWVKRIGVAQTLADYASVKEIVDKNKGITTKVQKFVSTDLSVGYVVFHPDFSALGYNTNSSWRSIVKPVKKGDTVTLYTVGGSNARGWGVTDKFYRNYSYSEENINSTLSPIVVTIENDGYFVANCNAANAAQFSLTIERKIDNVVEQDAKKVDSLPLHPRFHNAVFPYGKGDIRILSIGNSYAANSTAYLSELIAAAGLDDSKISHYILTSSASTLKYWAESEGTYTAVRVGGSRTMQNTGTLDQILAQDWDIVTIQQYSGDAVDYATYVPYLTQLVARIRAKCTNQKVCIMFNQAWAYWEDFTDYLKGDDRWKAITDAVTEMSARDGVDIIIPTGTAIQNARHTSLNTAHDLSIDGTHLAPGTGKYIAACCWYQMLYAPVFNVPMLGNTATHAVQPSEYDSSSYEWEDVTDANRGLCQECAFFATMDYKTIWEIE